MALRSFVLIFVSFLSLGNSYSASKEIISSSSAIAPATANQDQSLQQPPVPIGGTSSPIKIETTAKQVLLVDYITGVILLEKNPDELMHPSSMTKIMTAYMVFESLKNGTIQMNTAFPVSERAWRMGGSKMFVSLNSMVSVEDLLKGIIIQSGNDACIVMAEGLAGSEENFAATMTQRARDLGALQTTFRNSSGWPDPTHLTTARDLAIIAHRIITDFPEFYPLFGMKEYVFNNIRQWNRNPLLFKNIGCDGIKTGHTESGGYGIVVSTVQGNRRLILVANGFESEKERANEILKLSTWAMQAFENYSFFKSGDVVHLIPVWLGEDNYVEATVSEEVVMTLPRLSRKGFKVDVKYESPIAVPIAKGARIGTMIITLPSQELPIEVPLIAAKAIGKASFLKCIKDSFSYLIWGKVKD